MVAWKALPEVLGNEAIFVASEAQLSAFEAVSGLWWRLGGRPFEQLVNRAAAYLPMPKKTSRLKATEVGALSEPEMAARWIEAFGASNPQHLTRGREVLEGFVRGEDLGLR